MDRNATIEKYRDEMCVTRRRGRFGAHGFDVEPFDPQNGAAVTWCGKTIAEAVDHGGSVWVGADAMLTNDSRGTYRLCPECRDAIGLAMGPRPGEVYESEGGFRQTIAAVKTMVVFTSGSSLFLDTFLAGETKRVD